MIRGFPVYIRPWITNSPSSHFPVNYGIAPKILLQSNQIFQFSRALKTVRLITCKCELAQFAFHLNRRTTLVFFQFVYFSLGALGPISCLPGVWLSRFISRLRF